MAGGRGERFWPVSRQARPKQLLPIVGDKAMLAQTVERLAGLVDVKNPFDVTPMANDEAYAEMVASALGDPAVDAVVAGIVPLTPAMQTLSDRDGSGESVEAATSIASRLVEIAAGTTKPVVAVIDSGTRFDAMERVLEDGGVPVFRAADRAMRALRRYLNPR